MSIARSVVCALALAATMAAPAAGATSALVSLSSHRPGAKPVVLTIVLRYEMQCGYPGPGPIGVTLPAQMRMPTRIPRTAVLVDGHIAPSVAVSGRTISIGLPRPPQIMCDEISDGELTIAFTRSAGLENPARAGSYTLTASRSPSTFRARFAIS